MKHRKLSIFLIVLNGIGVLCLIRFAVPYLLHDTTLTNPDAMLPMQAWDGAGIALTIGLFPMIAANTLGFLFLFPKEKPIPLRLLCFLPGLIELILAASYVIPTVIGE